MLTVDGVSKRFGAVQALHKVSVSFHPGEIHAVLGENGAGKSTLMGVLAGFVIPDSGTVTLDGKPTPVGAPHEAKRCGIAMVHQHFTLVGAFTVAENLALATVDSLSKIHSPLQEATASLELATQLGWDLDPQALTADLPVGMQQRIEVLKALSADAGILIFDEPTAVLTPDEVLDLFRVLRSLRDAGKTIILIAHKLSEVLAIADRVTVLRRGAFVATSEIGQVDEAQLAEWMVGTETAFTPGTKTSRQAPVGLSVKDLHVRGDRGEPAVRGVSFEVASGEIFGIGGVDGNGQVELAEALASVRWPVTGSIDAGPAIAYIPQDRQSDGLALSLSVLDNLLIEGHRRVELRRGPMLRGKQINTWASGLIEGFDIKVGRLGDPLSGLSGGNQQKVVVARNLDRTPDLLVAANPTRGLDIKATRYVHGQIRLAANNGAVVVLLSTDLDELAELADRTYFMSRGELRQPEGAASLVGGD
jgi:simple sugar transport system ATP-binding protein